MQKSKLVKIVPLCLMLVLAFTWNIVGAAAWDTKQQPLPTAVHDNDFYINQAESIQAYNRLLEGFTAVQAAPAGLSLQIIPQEHPDYYGGAYIDEATGELVVLMKGYTLSNMMKVAALTDSSAPVRTQPCHVSYNEMCEVIELLTGKLEYLSTQGVVVDMVGDDIMNGKVIVSIVDLNKEKEQIVRSLVDCDFLEFSDSDGMKEQATNVGGGYLITGGGYNSTVGFAARMGNTSGFVISGHAVGDSVGMSFSYSGIHIGSVTKTAYRNFSSADAAFVAASSSVTPTQIIKNGGAIWAAQTGTLPVNASVCLYGAYSGLQSGKILGTNSLSISNGKTFTKQWRADYYSQNGDSGGPVMVYEGNYGGQSKYSLYGIHRGIMNSKAVLSSYKNIVDELGVTCITG